MAGEHVIFWRALSSELGTGTKFILGTSESGLRCEVWSFSAETERERESPTPDNTELPSAMSPLLSPLSPISRSVARTLPRRGNTRTTETTETGCLSGQTGQIKLCHKVYWWRRQDLIKANKDPCVVGHPLLMFWQCSNVPLFSRCLFLPVHAEAEAALAHHEAQHHLPDVRLPPGLRRLVLPQRRHVLHCQDRPVHSLQLRVSIQNDQLSFALKLVKPCLTPQ